jgi:hypothetical protein
VLAVQDNVAECALALTPDPDTEMMAGELVAVLAMVMIPTRFPAAAGAKVASNVAFCPGARIIPAETPCVERPAAELLTVEMDRLEFPELVIVIPTTLLLPTATFPKVKLDPVTFHGEVLQTPVPLTMTVAGELAELLRKETVPEAIPAAVGENDQLIVDCLPAPIGIGSDKAVTVNPGAAILSSVTIRFDPSVFDTEIDWESALPTATDPKLIDGGDTEMAAGVPGGFCVGWLDGFVAPEILTLKTITLELPALVDATPKILLWQILTLAKLRLVALRASAREAVLFELVFAGALAPAQSAQPEINGVTNRVARTPNQMNGVCCF